MKIHMIKKKSRLNRTRCGRLVNTLQITEDIEKITCEQCSLLAKNYPEQHHDRARKARTERTGKEG